MKFYVIKLMRWDGCIPHLLRNFIFDLANKRNNYIKNLFYTYFKRHKMADLFKVSEEQMKGRKLDQRELSEYSREELEIRVRQLEAHNVQLRNIILKKESENDGKSSNYKKKKDRPFDFSKHPRRHIALKFAYLGWDYSGFTVQEDTSITIEAELFKALLKTKLIEARETSNYHRCGRTDKGVSAFAQVVSLTVRCNLHSGLGVTPPSEEEPASVEEQQHEERSLDEELDYVQILNRVLTPKIRILAWSPVHSNFSSRFDCKSRTYKYFFPKGDLNIKAMEEAASYLIGSHDYRNFCKMDVGSGVVNFKRSIEKIEFSFPCINTKDRSLIIATENDKDSISGYNMCSVTINSQAFLWHQIRAIMAILFLVGEEKEQPSIVLDLLNIERYPRRPQYTIASEIPLVLYETEFSDLNWQRSIASTQDTINALQSQWMPFAIKSFIVYKIITDLKNDYLDRQNDNNKTSCLTYKGLSLCSRVRNYKPLSSRDTCDSLEEKISHFVKRRKLDPSMLEKTQTQKDEIKSKSDSAL